MRRSAILNRYRSYRMRRRWEFGAREHCDESRLNTDLGRNVAEFAE